MWRKMDKVSIIIPVYNVESYLDRCLQSVVGQTVPEIEILCIEDGSTDHSPAILEKWAKADSRIKVIHKKNGGISSARNIGLGLAQGPYLLFVDSDDWIEPDTVETALSHMKGEVDIVCWGAEIIAEGLPSDHPGVIQAKKYHKIQLTGEKEITNDIVKRSTVTVWNKLWKKSILDQFGIRFTEGRCFEDNDFTLMYFVHCRKGVYLDRYLYHYIQRPHSVMDQLTQGTFCHTIDYLYVFDRLYHHMVKYHMAEQWASLLTHRYSVQLRIAYRSAPVELKKEIRNCASQLAVGYNDRFFMTDCVKNVRQKNYALVQELNDADVSLQTGRAEQENAQLSSNRFQGGWKCLQDHGLSYTIKRTIEHFGIDMGTGDFRKNQ